MSARYKYALIDMSYILMRNLFAVSVGRKIGEFTAGSIIKTTFQTLNKVARDYGITADKFILVYDKWDRELKGYYRTSLLREVGGDYKGTRVYVDEAYVNSLKESHASEEEIAKAELELYKNIVKREAKSDMIENLGNFGIPCLGVEGWEYDDLTWLATCLLFQDPDPKPSVIITKDSDLKYSLSPKMEFFKIPTGKSAPEIITYTEMYNSIPEPLRERGLSLYDYKSYLDSLGEGHNDMKVTKKKNLKKKKKSVTDIILNIMDGNYTDLADVDGFLKQMASFNLSKFPRLDEAMDVVNNKFKTVGKLSSFAEFSDYCNKRGINITSEYYNSFIKRLNPELYKD